MNAWLALPDLLAREDVMLVTVAGVRGSTPREAGASMLVGTSSCCDTIGGGRLEWEAVAHARELLAQDRHSPVLLRLPLAASLGQCCGGLVWLLFERIEAAELPLWRQRIDRLQAGKPLIRTLSASATVSSWTEASEVSSSGCKLSEPAAHWHLHQFVHLTCFPVTIFGAGHVGEAIVRALLPLEAQIRWVDTREDVFPMDLASSVCCLHTDDPVQEVRDAKPGSMLLVLTHSHAIDLELCAQGLQRDDLAYFGMIGSHAKRARFEQRLLMRGFDVTQLANLTCPVGIAGIRSKLPTVIAASVVAQLLLVRERNSVTNDTACNSQHASLGKDLISLP